MAKAKPQPAPEPETSTEVSLGERIRALQVECEEFIQSKVQELKAAHPKLPIGWLEMDLRHRMKGGACNCKCALNILGEKDNG